MNHREKKRKIGLLVFGILTLTICLIRPNLDPTLNLNDENVPFSLKNSSTVNFGKKFNEIGINNYTTSLQWFSSPCALSSDSYAVTWHSVGQDTDGSGIYATVINATTGNNITREFRVNDYIISNQYYPSACTLSSDSIAVAWQSSGQDSDSWGVFARIINITTGIDIIPEFQVNDYITNSQSNPSTCALSSDSFVVAWESYGQDSSSYEIYAKVINATTGIDIIGEFRINDYITDWQKSPSICGLSSDSFAVAWQSYDQDGDFDGIYAKVINASTGFDIISEFLVNDHTTGYQTYPLICALSKDSFAVTWDSRYQDYYDGKGVYAKVINASTGIDIVGEFRVNDYIEKDQWGSSLCALSSDSFAVAWKSDRQENNYYEVYAKVINASTGNDIIAEFRVNDYITLDQEHPSTCALSSDSFAVTWDSEGQDGDNYGVYSTVYQIDDVAPETFLHFTTSHDPNFVINTTEFSLTSSDFNGTGVNDTYYQIDTDGWNIYAGSFKLSAKLEGNHNISFYSTDKAGNFEMINWTVVYLDKVAPNITLNFISDYSIDFVNISTQFSILYSDGTGSGISKIGYRTNNSAWIDYIGHFNLLDEWNEDGDGEYVIYYNCTDNVGNFEIRSKIVYLYEETSAPQSYINYDINISSNYVDSSTYFYLSAKDEENGSGVALILYKIDNMDNWTEYTTSFSLIGYNNGWHTIQFYSIDNIGNKEIFNSTTVHYGEYPVNNSPISGDGDINPMFLLLFLLFGLFLAIPVMKVRKRAKTKTIKATKIKTKYKAPKTNQSVENELIVNVTVEVICPICNAFKKVDIPKSTIDNAKSVTTVSIPKDSICPHHFQAFVDRNLAVWGYQRVDIILDSDAEKAKLLAKNFSTMKDN